MKVVVAVGWFIAMSGAALAAERSCLASAGRVEAERLVRRCRSISEATHPPCNVDNPCDRMIEEIASWCEINRQSRLNFKPFCVGYLSGRGDGR